MAKVSHRVGKKKQDYLNWCYQAEWKFCIKIKSVYSNAILIFQISEENIMFSFFNKKKNAEKTF